MGKIDLLNVEICEHCELNCDSGQVTVKSGVNSNGNYKGMYYKDSDTFFALYSSDNGPRIFFGTSSYAISPKLHINIRTPLIKKHGARRIFYIKEYGIQVPYKVSKYKDIDSWSSEKDIDLFMQIKDGYKSDDFYKKYTNIKNN